MADADVQMVRMLVAHGAYNARELRGLPPASAESLRQANACEFVERRGDQVKVTRKCKREEDEENKARLRDARLKAGGANETGLYKQEEIEHLFDDLAAAKAAKDKAEAAVEPLKRAKQQLSDELKQAREDNRAAAETISKQSKDLKELQAALAAAEAALEEATKPAPSDPPA